MSGCRNLLYGSVVVVSLLVAFVHAAAVEPRAQFSDNNACTQRSSNQARDCARIETWCTQRSYGDQGATALLCAPCLTGTISREGVPDANNLCNCPAGQYCRRITNHNNAGYCTPYTRIGLDCSTDDDCITERGHRINTLSSDQSSIEGQLFCLQGTCRECNPTNWQADSTMSPLGVPLTCGGLDMIRSEQYGFEYFLSSRPGETRTCHANGTLSSGGAIDYSLVTIQALPNTTTTTTTAVATTSTTTVVGNDTTSDADQHFFMTMAIILVVALALARFI